MKSDLTQSFLFPEEKAFEYASHRKVVDEDRTNADYSVDGDGAINISTNQFMWTGSPISAFAGKIKSGKLDPNVLIRNIKNTWVPLFFYIGFRNFEKDSILRTDTFVDELDIVSYCWKCYQNQKLRDFLEVEVALDPLMADVLYRLDHMDKVKDKDKLDLFPPTNKKSKAYGLTTWQSYGRKFIVDFDNHIRQLNCGSNKICIVLPCSATRPYKFEGVEEDLEDPNFYPMVVSSIGIVPKENWADNFIMKYNAGVPDIWRIFKLCKTFFTNNKFSKVIVYLDYSPYIEILEVLQKLLGLNIEFKHKKTFNKDSLRFSVE